VGLVSNSAHTYMFRRSETRPPAGNSVSSGLLVAGVLGRSLLQREARRHE
jgi:hypothetical protein